MTGSKQGAGAHRWNTPRCTRGSLEWPGRHTQRQHCNRSITTAPVPAPAAPASTSSPATLAAAILARPCLVDRQVSAVVLAPIEGFDGGLSLGIGPHLDETKPLRPARLPIHDDLNALHCAKLREQRLEAGLIRVETQVADVELLSHR